MALPKEGQKRVAVRTGMWVTLKNNLSPRGKMNRNSTQAAFYCECGEQRIQFYFSSEENEDMKLNAHFLRSVFTWQGSLAFECHSLSDVC